MKIPYHKGRLELVRQFPPRTWINLCKSWFGAVHKHVSTFSSKQFEEFVLDACMYLLDKSKLKLSNRRDPMFVSRAMSALVCLSCRSALPLQLSLLLLTCSSSPGALNTISGCIRDGFLWETTMIKPFWVEGRGERYTASPHHHRYSLVLPCGCLF